jgi:RNA polymerase sigma factor (sigma-70 family)
MLAASQGIERDHQLLIGALPMVERWARKVTQRYGNRLGDDVQGIGTLALCEALPRFKDGPGRSLGKFAKRRVFGAMMNEVARSVEHARRDHDAVLMSLDETDISSAQDLLADAEENVIAVEALRAVLRDLRAEDRLLLDLLFGSELDQHRVGQVLGVSHETVCRRLRRLRTRLRRRLVALGLACAPPPMRLPGLQPVVCDRVTGARAA